MEVVIQSKHNLVGNHVFVLYFYTNFSPSLSEVIDRAQVLVSSASISMLLAT